MTIKTRRNINSFFQNLDKERGIVVAALSFIFLLITVDIIHEIYSGVDIEELQGTAIIEGSILSTILLTVSFIWKRYKLEHKLKKTFHQDLVSSKVEVEKWKTKTELLLENSRNYIDDQMDAWSLTRSEKEVAKLLLQGLSSKEMAQERNTSDRTIRNQCQVIYQKSNLKGKSELMAFFLKKVLS